MRRAVVLLLCAAGCVGAIGETPPTPLEPPPAEMGCRPGTPARLRRLTTDEYASVVADLFGAAVPRISGFPLDPRVNGFGNDATALVVSGPFLDEAGHAAEELAASLPIERLAPCPAGQTEKDCARAFAHGFGQRAYGRPMAASEVERLGSVFEAGRDPGGYQEGVRLMAEAILQSPHFLYATELGGGGAGTTRLTQWELASRLSFFLTGARPGPTLRAAVEAGRLTDADGIETEVRHLLDTPRARQHLRGFFTAWLGLDDLPFMTKDGSRVAEFTRQLRDEMTLEVRRYLDHAIAAGASLAAIFGGTLTFPGLEVARVVYENDILTKPAVDGEEVSLDTRRRKGILSLPGTLATHSTVDRTSPVDRGLLVAVRLLCQEIAPPPGGLVIPAIDTDDLTRTTRAKQESHAAASCAGCHDRIDPIGFGLENMDTLGRYRATENNKPVDSSGELVGSELDFRKFNGPAELADRLLASNTFRECFVTQLWRYAEARLETDADACVLADLKQSLRTADDPLVTLIVALTRHPTFTSRRNAP